MTDVAPAKEAAALPGGPAIRALQAEVRDLYEEVADYLDDDQIERLPGYFTEDCIYKVISKENYDEGLEQAAMYCDGIAMLHDRILAHRETQVFEHRAFRHFISGVRITSVEGDTIRSRANFMLTESMSDAEPRLLMVGRYLDTLVRRDQRLLFRKRLAVYDNFHVYLSLVVPI